MLTAEGTPGPRQQWQDIGQSACVPVTKPHGQGTLENSFPELTVPGTGSPTMVVGSMVTGRHGSRKNWERLSGTASSEVLGTAGGSKPRSHPSHEVPPARPPFLRVSLNSIANWGSSVHLLGTWEHLLQTTTACLPYPWRSIWMQVCQCTLTPDKRPPHKYYRIIKYISGSHLKAVFSFKRWRA